MTLQLAVRITGDASSLQQSAAAGSAAVKGVAAAAAAAAPVAAGAATAIDGVTRATTALGQAQVAAGAAAGGQASAVAAVTAEVVALGRAAETSQKSVAQLGAAGIAPRVAPAAGPGAPAMPSAGPVVPGVVPAVPPRPAPPVNDNTRPTLRADQWKNLGFQANDIATSFAGGLPITQILAQQGGQVVQVLADAPGGVAGGLKVVATRAMEILTPVRLVSAGFVGLAATVAYLGVSWARSQDEIKTGLMGIGAMSRATVADINRIAEASAAGGKIGRGDARNVAAQLAATGRVDVSQIQGVTDLAPGLAKLTGKSIRDAGGDLAKMFADPVKGAQALNEIVGGLNAGTQNYIRTLIEQGNRQEAVRQIVAAFGPDLEKAAQKTTAWGRTWEWVANQAERAGAAVARPFMPTTAQQGLDKAREDLNQLQGAQTQPSPTASLFGGLTQDILRQRAANAAPKESDAVKAKKAEIKGLEELAEREKRLAEADAARKLAADRSQTAEAAVRATQPEIAALEQLTTRYETLKAVQGDLDALSGMSAAARGQLTDAIDGAGQAVKTFMSAQERARASESLTIRSIEARTAAEKAAVAAERERLALAGQAISEDDRRQRVEAARQAVLAQTNRDSQDRLRSANDNAASAGLLPYQRQQADLDAKYREQNKRDQGSPEALANNRAAQAAERRAIDAEAIGGPLRDANRGLAEQVAALRNQQLAFGASTEAAARLAAAQELINRYTAAGVPISADLKRQIDAYAASAGKVAAAQEDLLRRQREVIGGLDDVRGGIRGGLTGIFSDVSQGKSPLDGITNTLNGLSSRLFDRTVSGPLTKALIGQDGKGGGGLFGDTVSSIFGKAAGLPSADITAGVVNVSGPVSGIPGLTGGAGASSIAADVAGGKSPAEAAGGILKGLTGSKSDVAAYVQQAASLRGIDPNVALRVIRQESGFNIGAQNLTSREQSYGVMQLNTMGGLGAEALKAGIDVRDPSTWRRQVDFGLDVVKKDGWRQWYGARDVGISRWEGIGQAPSAASPPAPAMTGLTNSLDQINTSASTASQGVASLGTDLAALPGPLTQTSQGLTQVGSALGGQGGGGGLLGMLANLLGGGASAGSAAPAATVTAATGGHIHGPGSGTSDSIHARLSNGEFVTNAASTAKHLSLLHAINNDRLPMFADGGVVGQIRSQTNSGVGGAGGSDGLVVNVNNYASNAQVSTRQEPDGRGGRQLVVQVDEMTAAAVGRPGSKTAAVLARPRVNGR